MDRRNFWASLAGITVATSSNTFGSTTSSPADCLLDGSMPPLPSLSLYDQNEDVFWAALRNQFLIPKDEVYLNNGTVG